MKTQHEILTEDPEFRRLLSVEALAAEASEIIAKLMADQNMSKADLARHLNKSRAWVTQLLSGKANMTVRTLAEAVYALGAEVKLHAQRPCSQMAEKSLDSGWKPITFKIDGYVVDSPSVPELFRLETDRMTSQNELIPMSPGDEPMRPKFAA